MNITSWTEGFPLNSAGLKLKERGEVSENKNSLSSFRYVNNVDTDPLWTARSLVTNPEAVRKVHTDFLAAGARIVLTCSYQVSVNLFNEELNLTRAQTREHIGRDELLSLPLSIKYFRLRLYFEVSSKNFKRPKTDLKE